MKITVKLRLVEKLETTSDGNKHQKNTPDDIQMYGMRQKGYWRPKEMMKLNKERLNRHLDNP